MKTDVVTIPFVWYVRGMEGGGLTAQAQQGLLLECEARAKPKTEQLRVVFHEGSARPRDARLRTLQEGR